MLLTIIAYLHLQLLLYTDPADASYGDTALALKKVGEAASFNNEAIRDFTARVKTISKMLAIVCKTGINVLDSPARVLIKEGVLRGKLKYV